MLKKTDFAFKLSDVADDKLHAQLSRALHYSVDFIFLSVGSMDFIVEL